MATIKQKESTKLFLAVDTGVAADGSENLTNCRVLTEPDEWLTLFEGDTPDNANQYLKKFKLVKSLESLQSSQGIGWMLYDECKENRIRDIKSIANPEKPKNPVWKTEEYYCILNSDGDSMGKLFKSCATDEEEKK